MSKLRSTKTCCQKNWNLHNFLKLVQFCFYNYNNVSLESLTERESYFELRVVGHYIHIYVYIYIYDISRACVTHGVLR